MLRIESLDAHYGLFQALFGVTLSVAPGETVSLIGSNGAGKTTLLRAMAGALKVRRDSIRLDGDPVGGASEREQLARGVALVPEGRRLFPSLTVHENLQLAARNGRPGAWTVERVLESFPALRPLLARPATALSGGQQQLVAIARALVCNPQYLLCDEVSLGLSPLVVEEVYQLLALARRDGMAIVLVEQNVRRALAESDRYVCIQKGRVVLEGISASADRHAVAQAYFGV
ncbi:ABC transporter ATP-binding protein [Aquabacterium sp.]|uniref:ABC transporter ATP-binding protein n=1 Tax=Aquabacterium sp. TaxID=1872578 RepID=UPI0037848604